jgi:hypothetical protein
VDEQLQSLLTFLDGQRERHAAHFPTVVSPKVLSFMGTTSLAGTHAAVGANRVLGLQGVSERELHVKLAGGLPRPPGPGESITVMLVDPDRFQGFQVKTRPVGLDGLSGDLVIPGPDGITIRGSQIYTVHHSPYTMKFFERIPHDEVLATVGKVPHALVAVGETANLSPRFIFHHEAKMGRPALFHGDGLALKTYMNLKSNRQEVRLVVDLDTFAGYALKGTVEEFQPHQYPEIYERICQGFASGNWGKPSRVFRHLADGWQPLAPV